MHPNVVRVLVNASGKALFTETIRELADFILQDLRVHDSLWKKQGHEN